MLLLKDLPKYDTLQRFADRYAEMDVSAVQTFLMLLRVASDVIENLDACLARHDLLQGRWWVLILLMREQNLTASPSVLADKAGVTRATMTGLLDSLERAELIERIPNPDDRRMLNVRLTEKGQQRLDEVMPDYYSRVARVMEELSEDHRQLLMEMLSNVGSRVDLLGAA
ncbi:MAG: MarR family winged helix-turn-helix transcriptional regulator [Methylophilaceae bacterium]|jgi:DNA-binding MarR family transcriptional regulator|uniref:MarR family winged helix-turn-helix transcriptional regulator n=1 Tax=Methylobacillus sp. MM3 TaxID=1848039 RepID=UPI0007E070D3|nr:MarR family transcriptional regulator [Methylobacillus sp. MM3]OAJ71401.1 MarR family transcriptional regulator [Methylobacillus sp. MM3]